MERMFLISGMMKSIQRRNGLQLLAGGTYYTNFSNMPAKNLSMYGFKKQEGSDIVYYIETIDGKIKEYQSYNISYSHLTSEDAQPIDGFSFDMNDSLNYGWYKDGGNYVKK